MENHVRSRYASAATQVEAALCCASQDYDPALLENVPAGVREIDYGCGNPTGWIESGDTVLDLGSGSGKICYMASQVVGREGRVIGIDFNQPMLDVARGHQAEFAAKMGLDNLSFRKGRIQDLALDLDQLEAWLAENPVTGADDFLRLEEESARLRAEGPMVATESVDCIVSNCVLNLVETGAKAQLFREMHRVLKRGGRCVISDIVSDEDVPMHLQRDPQLWSSCASGAYREDLFLKAFEEVGFYGVEIVERANEPWQVVEGIEFRSVTVRAYKGKEGPCLDRNQAVVYRGPWKAVVDDDGHTLYRGERMAVCDKTFRIYTRAPYTQDIDPVLPLTEVPLDEATEYDCRRNARRYPRETKGEDYSATIEADGDCCGADGACC